MGISTKDRAKLGKTTYLASVTKWVGEEPCELNRAEFFNLDVALDHVKGLLRGDEALVAGNIYEGTYVADDIPDEQYGVIYGVDWNEHDVLWYLQRSEDGSIQVEENRW